MIYLPNVKEYCREDVSKIENYCIAKNSIERYCCHHRFEDFGLTPRDLKDMGLYYKRPASELIFMSFGEHIAHHKKGNTNTLGKKHDKETCEKIANTQLNNPKRSKKVYQYTLDGCFVKEWPSANEVGRTLNVNSGFIGTVCRGEQKTAYNYIWSYTPLTSSTM